ncbi:olfactory receptor 287-like [Hyperolius riggenbachi]|uniref:olfactory receptor 287-like n=1 Tax=Hyperolius riggenbachi TaxID=752182 RepID=UPI0035A32167
MVVLVYLSRSKQAALEVNQTTVTTIVLLGFQNLRSFKVAIFILLFLAYIVTICGNFLIILLVSCSKTLRHPMYFFISQLSVADVMLSADIVPNMLKTFLEEHVQMSLTGCLTQFFFFGAAETSECLLLMVMSFDRYLAICNPLRYNSIMDLVLSLKLVLICWLLTIAMFILTATKICNLHFCRRVINHLFCDLFPLLDLSCSDTSVVQMEIFLLCVPVVVLPSLVIVISYIYITLTILRIPTGTGKQKAFSTCSSHLTVVVIYYGSLMAIYFVPSKGQSLVLSKVLSLLYTVVTPLLNPIIYSLRNKDIQKALEKLAKI